MQANPAKKSFLQKQFPTLIGLTILVIALVGGIYLVGSGGGVFNPRATPQTTPKKIKLTNVTNNSFTVSFLTDESVSGFVKYGTEAEKLNSQASDDRDQLSGSVSDFQTHHITVRGLKPNTTYYYLLGTGRGSTFDNNGAAFTVKTTQQGGSPPAAKTVYGSVLNPAGAPADGSLVYVAIEGVGEMSSLVKSSGSWAISLSNARLTDGSGFAQVEDDAVMSVLVQGPSAAQTSQFQITVGQAQPVTNVTLGQVPDVATVGGDAAVSPGSDGTPTNASASATGAASSEAGAENAGDNAALGGNSVATPGTRLGSSQLGSPISSPSSSLNDLLASIGSTSSSSESAATPNAVVDLSVTTKQTVTTTTPIIRGTAAPNVTVSIEVHSEHEITQTLTSDANGNFELDIEALKKNLEPGEHTATYTYTDPTTGKAVTKTVTFTVEAPSPSPAAQSGTGGTASPYPYGSGNPYPASGSASPSPKASATPKTGSMSAIPSTSSAIPKSGAVGTTVALLLGGFFFIIAGMWSYWLAGEVERE